MKQKKLWIVYDGRATPREHLPSLAKKMIAKASKQWAKQFFPGNTDRASVLVSCNSLKEARSYKDELGSDNCIYEYDVEGRTLVNEKFVEVL